MNMKISPIEEISQQHERLGKIVTEIITGFVKGLDDRRVASEATPAELVKLFDEPLPEQGVRLEDLLDRFTRDIAPHAMGVPSPRYYGQFNPTPLPIGVWADALCSALNQNAGAWRNGPTSAIIEARVMRWLCQVLGYGPESFGTLASGGLEANLIALKCARDSIDKRFINEGVRSAPGALVIYASEQCHYSVEKSADILGLGREAVRKIPTDERFHIRTDQLRAAIEGDRQAGRIPCCVVGVAGATSTGVVDPLEELASIAREHGCWYHVDAAYGGALAFSEKHKAKLNGIEQADSITFDPHKWLFVPFACGATLVRDGGSVLRDAFDITPEYLSEDRGGADVEFDFFRYGQMGTRRFNSLKLWMALQFMGRQGYAETVERHIDLTTYLACLIDQFPDFQRLGELETAVCCLRFMPPALQLADGRNQDRVQQRLQQRIERSGEAWLTTTVLKGRRALRVNINSYLTERRHIDDLVELLVRESRTALEDI
ncbi:MAG TPA: aminotransferase class I/II-fold pyridoxal phosphate-dependent enzyme [Pyrinomonadaceae bacterium]|nr:aminotransferase class I/II-fold pyridoxal phosphate-dependent enzyme [Pyrinomonadaceae bacterium]